MSEYFLGCPALPPVASISFGKGDLMRLRTSLIVSMVT